MKCLLRILVNKLVVPVVATASNVAVKGPVLFLKNLYLGYLYNFIIYQEVFCDLTLGKFMVLITALQPRGIGSKYVES